MSEQFRNQVNTARRAGYSDMQIADFLKNTDPRVDEALQLGYSPEEVVQYLAPKLTTGEEVVRKTGIAARGASEALAPVTAGALGGAGLGLLTGVGAPIAVPVGALAGGLAVPTADALVMGYNALTDSNVRRPSQIISEMLPGPRAETPTERVLQSTSGAFAGTGGAVQAGRSLTNVPNVLYSTPVGRPGTTVAAQPVAPGVRAIGAEVSRAPVGQLIAAPVSTAVGQTVTEATDNPFLGMAATVATSSAMGLRPTKREKVPTADEVMARSKANYEVLDNSGFQLDDNQFRQHMATLAPKLRTETGYIEAAYPKVSAALSELQTQGVKDVAQITGFRKIISGVAKSGDPQERLIASNLLDEFDDYIINAPTSAIVGGDKKAVAAWKEARADYTKFKKAELITDIVDRAEVSQSSKESALANGLSSLAKDKKKMRFFTADEQQAIRDAAKGGKIQTMLRTVGKFTPLTPAAAIFTAVNPYGAYTAAAGMTAGELAKMRRYQQVNRLADRMLLGAEPNVLEGPLANQPVFFSRGMQNAMNPQQQNQMAPTRQNALVR